MNVLRLQLTDAIQDTTRLIVHFGNKFLLKMNNKGELRLITVIWSIEYKVSSQLLDQLTIGINSTIRTFITTKMSADISKRINLKDSSIFPTKISFPSTSENMPSKIRVWISQFLANQPLYQWKNCLSCLK